jgi:hypothetical protein
VRARSRTNENAHVRVGTPESLFVRRSRTIAQVTRRIIVPVSRFVDLELLSESAVLNGLFSEFQSQSRRINIEKPQMAPLSAQTSFVIKPVDWFLAPCSMYIGPKFVKRR